MAFGFPPSHTERIELNITRQAARDAVIYAFEALGWRFESPDNDSFQASVPFSGFSWGEQFFVSLANSGAIEIRSRCSPPIQFVDWGKNKRNVRDFLARFEPKVIRDARLPPPEPPNFDPDGKTPLDRALSEP